MAAKTWVLTDWAEAKHVAEITLDHQSEPVVPAGVSITKRTWQGGLADGVDELRVNNGVLQFSVLPTRGMGIWKGWIAGQTLGWKSPVRGPVHPKFVPLHDPTGLGWLEGFDEWICRCGATSNGAPDFNTEGQLTYPLHGRLANLPAQHVAVTVEGDEISVRGTVWETRFHFQKLELSTTLTTRRNQAGFSIRDEIRNLSASEAECQLLYHCNFGAPLLGAGAELVASAAEVVPRNAWSAENIGHWSTYSAPTAGTAERVFFLGGLATDSDGETHVLLKDAKSSRGVSLSWNPQQLPCFTLWKNETSSEDGYVTGLEPGTNFPNPRSFEARQGRVIQLAPHASHVAEIAFHYHGNLDEVATIEQTVRSLAQGTEMKLHPNPLDTWCAP